MSKYEEKIEELDIEVPEPPKPVGAYVPATRAGNLVFSSGQGPMKHGKPIYRGKVGSDLSVQEGYEAAKISAINCLAAIKGEIGSLNEIKKIVKVRGFVSSAKDFNKQPEVVNGASEILHEIFGENGKHARAAVGVSELPINIPVEVEMIVSVK